MMCSRHKASRSTAATPIAQHQAQFWRDRVIAAARHNADAYLISCANISVFGVIDDLETRLERPIVTSNQAVIWDALRLIGWRMPPRHLGRLFAVSSADLPVHVTPAG
jgi:maleate cis-trans isomerase